MADTCALCDEPATDIEHLPPKWLDILVAKRELDRPITHYEVHLCRTHSMTYDSLRESYLEIGQYPEDAAEELRLDVSKLLLALDLDAIREADLT